MQGSYSCRPLHAHGGPSYAPARGRAPRRRAPWAGALLAGDGSVPGFPVGQAIFSKVAAPVQRAPNLWLVLESVVSSHVRCIRRHTARARGHDRGEAAAMGAASVRGDGRRRAARAQGRYARSASATNSDRLAAIQGEYEAARKEMEKEAVRAARLEQRLGLLTGGYAGREAKLRAGIDAAWAAERAAQQARAARAPALPGRAAGRQTRRAAEWAVSGIVRCSRSTEGHLCRPSGLALAASAGRGSPLHSRACMLVLATYCLTCRRPRRRTRQRPPGARSPAGNLTRRAAGAGVLPRAGAARGARAGRAQGGRGRAPGGAGAARGRAAGALQGRRRAPGRRRGGGGRRGGCWLTRAGRPSSPAAALGSSACRGCSRSAGSVACHACWHSPCRRACQT